MPDYKRKMNITVPIEYGDDKTFWHNIGKAFENDKGQITGYLNSLPVPGKDGKVKFMLFEAKEDDDRRSSTDSRSTKNGGSSKSKGGRTTRAPSDDEIPF